MEELKCQLCGGTGSLLEKDELTSRLVNCPNCDGLGWVLPKNLEEVISPAGTKFIPLEYIRISADEYDYLRSKVHHLTKEVTKLREELGHIISTGKMWEQRYGLDVNERTLVEMAEDAVRESDKRIAAQNPVGMTSQDVSEG